MPTYAWLFARKYAAKIYGSGTRDLIRSGVVGLSPATSAVLAAHRYRAVIERLSKGESGEKMHAGALL
ncbi:MAG: hypothetical protein Rhirs2KO_03800 [Rhizobiaceae bacterium]